MRTIASLKENNVNIFAMTRKEVHEYLLRAVLLTALNRHLEALFKSKIKSLPRMNLFPINQDLRKLKS